MDDERKEASLRMADGEGRRDGGMMYPRQPEGGWTEGLRKVMKGSKKQASRRDGSRDVSLQVKLDRPRG